MLNILLFVLRYNGICISNDIFHLCYGNAEYALDTYLQTHAFMHHPKVAIEDMSNLNHIIRKFMYVKKVDGYLIESHGKCRKPESILVIQT